MGNLKIEQVQHEKYGKCLNVTNGDAYLLVPLGFGPRIIKYGLAGKESVFCEDETLKVKVDGGEWKLRGGHRLWHSPEAMPRTYIPDDKPVKIRRMKNGLRVTADVEAYTNIGKEIEISMEPSGSGVTVIHRLENANAWAVKFAAWSLSVMAAGGTEFIPLPDRDKLEDKNYSSYLNLSMWPYTKMNDPRVTWGEKYIILRQDKTSHENIKIGFNNEDGWAAYINNGAMFVKRYDIFIDEEYPDRGCSYETFTNNFMLEMEALSPYVEIPPEGILEHVEKWEIIDGIGAAPADEKGFDRIAKKYIKKA